MGILSQAVEERDNRSLEGGCVAATDLHLSDTLTLPWPVGTIATKVKVRETLRVVPWIAPSLTASEEVQCTSSTLPMLALA